MVLHLRRRHRPAVLAKGPVGLLLPGAVEFLFLAWQRDLRRLLDRRLILSVLVFLGVAAPWYVWVGVDTKGKWLAGFWIDHHQERLLTVLDNHGGPIFYYLVVTMVGLAPWSVFTYVTGRHFLSRDPERDERTRAGLRFLVCWVGVFLVAFSLARTKLPNYVLPLYPAAAVLLAGYLDRWRRGLDRLPAWTTWLSVGCFGLVGITTVLAILAISGTLPGVRGRVYPGLERLVYLGLPAIVGAAAAGWCLRRQSAEWLRRGACARRGDVRRRTRGLGSAGRRGVQERLAPSPPPCRRTRPSTRCALARWSISSPAWSSIAGAR